MANSSKKSPERTKVRLVCVLPSSNTANTEWFYVDEEDTTYGPYRTQLELFMDLLDSDIVVEYTV